MSPADPQRSDSDSEPPAEPTPPAPEKPGGRPDWLVGAEEGVRAEQGRTPKPAETRSVLKMVKAAPDESHDGQDLPVPQLDLGGPLPSADESGTPTRLTLLRPSQQAMGAEGAAQKAPEPKKPWAAAASSIPTLRREPPAPVRAAPVRAMPDEPQEFDAPVEREGMRDLPADHPTTAPPKVALPPLREAWWIVALEELRTNRKIQIGAVLVAVAFAAFTFWPRSRSTVSIADLEHHAKEYDGRAVTVRGRVGDVFPAGGGYTFYLRQGNSTIVVFTRSRVPVPNQSITVKGTISTGFLDGSPHQSLFEGQ